MAEADVPADDLDQDAPDAPAEAAAPAPGGGTGWAGWAISTTLHLLLLLIMWGIYWVIAEPEVETPPVRIATIDPPVKREEPPKPERSVEETLELDVPTVADTVAPVTALDLPVEEVSQEAEQESEVPKGREEAISDSEMGGSGAFMAVGAGGGSAGMFGSRTGGGKRRAIGAGGGSKGSEAAVDAALRWFKRHQGPDGGWDAEDYWQNCQEAPKCEPAKATHCTKESAAVAMTGYAVLCFLGAGYDHRTPNKYKPVVAKGIERLLAWQKPDGLLGERNYEHPVAAMALAEALAMTGDPKLKEPAQRAVDVIVARQNTDPKGAKAGYGNGLGWDYVGPTDRNDSSVTGWNVMALKSALAAGLNVGTAMDGAKAWLERTWKATNPTWASLDPYGTSRFPYTWSTATDKVSFTWADGPGEPRELACVGSVCAVFLGRHAGDPMLETLANFAVEHQLPVKYPCNTYYLYYNTLAIFQVGGERWKKWNSAMRDNLVNAQRRDACFDGSWDWEGTKFIGYENGRVLNTAYCCLSLQVYYRYAQVAGAGKRK